MKFVRRFLIFCSLFFISYLGFSQPFTHADTLRGSNGPHRSWWDVLQYNLTIKPDFSNKTIEGYAAIKFKVLRIDSLMQIDLQEPLTIDSFTLTWVSEIPGESYGVSGNMLYPDSSRKGNTYFLCIPRNSISLSDSSGLLFFITIYYHGKPHQAVNPPWDGGVVWTKDTNNNPWMSSASQDLGASSWFPCKDIQSDEPDSGAVVNLIVPTNLVGVSNGRLQSIDTVDNNTTQYTWKVKSSINNYDIVPYIGKYVHFGDVYKGEKGNLNMDYWVLDYNLEKAKKEFSQAAKMMKAFEYWFGPYPFYEDGYKLVEAPYLGMENQSAIAYGNDYMNGYKGKDLSRTGWGLRWDFIIVHESAHEWFGNNITTKDIADMWVHEGFANYAEALFTEYYYGKKAGDDYVIGLRKNIVNDVPVISPYGVNKEGSEDMYWKASNMIHTIRQVINNDSLFIKILKGLNTTFYHQTVTTKQVEDYITTESHIDFSTVFDQYLRTVQIPVLEYKISKDSYSLSYRWTNCVKGFRLPLKINFKGERWINPTGNWQTLSMYPEGETNFSVDRNFYINTKKVD